jgi:hypothetical protein
LGKHKLPEDAGLFDQITDKLGNIKDTALAPFRHMRSALGSAADRSLFSLDKTYSDTEAFTENGRNSHPTNLNELIRNIGNGAVLGGGVEIASTALGMVARFLGETSGFGLAGTIADAAFHTIAGGVGGDLQRSDIRASSFAKAFIVFAVGSALAPLLPPVLGGTIGATAIAGVGAEIYSHLSDHSEILTKMNKSLGAGAVEAALIIGVASLLPLVGPGILAPAAIMMGVIQAAKDNEQGKDISMGFAKGLVKGAGMAAFAASAPLTVPAALGGQIAKNAIGGALIESVSSIFEKDSK